MYMCSSVYIINF